MAQAGEKIRMSDRCESGRDMGEEDKAVGLPVVIGTRVAHTSEDEKDRQYPSGSFSFRGYLTSSATEC